MTVGRILARVYTPEDGRIRPKHVAIRYMKEGTNVAFKMAVTRMYN
jgi:hypothetical protein